MRARTADLRLLADLLATGRLDASVEVERPWDDIADVADDLSARRFKGEAVLRIPER